MNINNAPWSPPYTIEERIKYALIPAGLYIRHRVRKELRRGEPELSTPEFMKKVRETAGKLSIDPEMLRRAVNVGFSGGEKKRNEILQMSMLEPRLAVLDETDSGLDIDALRIVSEGVNRLRSPERSMIVITHYQRLLDYIVPDVVHVLSKGRVVKTGGKDLALELEARGYAQYQDEAVA